MTPCEDIFTSIHILLKFDFLWHTFNLASKEH